MRVAPFPAESTRKGSVSAPPVYRVYMSNNTTTKPSVKRVEGRVKVFLKVGREVSAECGVRNAECGVAPPPAPPSGRGVASRLALPESIGEKILQKSFIKGSLLATSLKQSKREATPLPPGGAGGWGYSALRTLHSALLIAHSPAAP